MKHFIYSNTTLLTDTYSPLSLSITITLRPPGQKQANRYKLTTKINIISILQPSLIKQYKDQQYFPNLALIKPSSKIIKLA